MLEKPIYNQFFVQGLNRQVNMQTAQEVEGVLSARYPDLPPKDREVLTGLANIISLSLENDGLGAVSNIISETKLSFEELSGIAAQLQSGKIPFLNAIKQIAGERVESKKHWLE